METEQAFIEDMIERYVYQASRHMPSAGREDAARELRALICDMLSERANGLPPTKKQLEAVFVELGTPSAFGQRYKSEEVQTLIGKRLFPSYIKIIKIVAAAVPFALAIAMLIQALSGHLAWYLALAQWIWQSLSALFFAFGIITIVFAVFERKGVKLEELDTASGPFDLPPVPKHQPERVNIGGLIAGIVFTIVFSLLFALAPNVFALYTAQGDFIPLFNAARVHEFLPLLLILLVLGVGKELCGLFKGNFGLRAFLLTSALSLLNLVFTLLVFGDGTVWNAHFMTDAAAVFGAQEPFFDIMWHNVTHYFPFLFVLAYGLEIASNAYKAFGQRAVIR